MDLYLPLKIMIYAHDLFQTETITRHPKCVLLYMHPTILQKSKISIKSIEMQYICLIMHKYIYEF